MRLFLLPAALVLMAAAPPPSAITLPADAPIAASINGQPVSLSLATGAIDRIVLNIDVVRQLGLKPAVLMGKANVRVGRTRVLPGRNAPGAVMLTGVRFNQRLFWFEGAGPIAEQGSIGPMALPQRQVTVLINPAGGGREWALPLVGDISSGSYGGVKGGGTPFALSVDVRGRLRLPLATAALGADIAAGLGGRLVGEPWEEEIFLGVRRPVRRLLLDRPLELGPFRFSEIAVRVNDRRDGMAQLAQGQAAPPDADADDDPSEIVVTADTGKQRRVVRSITLSRTQLDAAGCSALVVDKAARRFVLRC